MRLLRPFLLLLCCLLPMPLCLAASSKPQLFVYPASEIANDTRHQDLIEILRTALDKTVTTYGPYQLRASNLPMPKLRYLSELEQGGEITVIWTSTSNQMEQRYLPIRVPLRQGLMGYRVCLITRDMQARIDLVKTVADLKQLVIGQGQNWGDTAVYEAHGIPVMRAKYENLFPMLANKRFDLFPRGVNEVFAEWENYRQTYPDLVVEKNLLIHYVWPYYFFVRHGDQARAERISAGLRKMQKDGSLEAIFRKYHARNLQRAQLQGRRVIELDNPLLPPDAPPDDILQLRKH